MIEDTLTLTAQLDPLAPTIFHEDWWLDIVTGGRIAWAEERENGQTIGRLPYLTVGRRSSLTRRIVMPLITHFLGPALVEGEGLPNTRLAHRIELTRALIGQLPQTISTNFKCHAGVTDTIAFQMEGFRTNVQYTYEIEPQSHDELWAHMRSPRRTIIRGAQRVSQVEMLADAGAFMHFYDENLKAAGKTSILDSTVCVRLIEACLKRGRGAIYAARKDGHLQAAIFCVWDARASYYLMTTRRIDSHSGAISLLTFKAIQDAAMRGLTFDLDGLCDAGGVRFFTGFGGRVAPRYIVTRDSRPMKLYRAVRAAFGGENTYA
jgi:hypothetical protein